MPRNLKNLVQKLDRVCRKALEGAASLCLSRTHAEVDIEHFVLQLSETDDTDIHRILKYFEVDRGRLEQELNNALDRFKGGNTRTPVISARLPHMLERAWISASVEFNAQRTRSGHILLTLLEDADFFRIVEISMPCLQRVPAAGLRADFGTITAGSPEELELQELAGVGAATAAGASAGGGRSATPGLDQYTTDLTQQAADGKIDPVLGRSAEIRQIIDILSRRRQNNPILTGEPGVGKTAVIEGLALRIAQGDIPRHLQKVRLLALDLGLLQAGAGVRGEFENRLRSVIDDVKRSPNPVVLFIDEAHQLIGAGGQAGQGDAANMLKPALARGELRTIAATTWSEYKRYFEKDAALARRFQVVKIDEPDEQTAVIMIRGLAAGMSRHHGVRISDDAVVQAVKLSHRYLAGRHLPDKAVGLLDTACARVAIGQDSTPAPIEDARRRIESLSAEIAALELEQRRGVDVTERVTYLQEGLANTTSELEALEGRWKVESELVARIQALYDQLEKDDQLDKVAEGDGSTAQPEEQRTEVHRLQDELLALQGDSPLSQILVNGQVIAEVLGAWTGIPVGRMMRNEIETVMRLDAVMGERVIGQSHGLRMISERIRISRASLEDPNKPIGVFMLVGPSGVGKTETALTLADNLYGGERNLITINMSEFQEAHTVSSLKGAPPGYVGYGEGGVLTEAVRRRPYSVVLLDEVEKAHPDVLELFFQVFDKGMLDDGEGRTINFKNTIIVLTSNVGTQKIVDMCRDQDNLPDPEDLVNACWPELERAFKPAFLGRLVVIPYFPVLDDVLKQIVRLKLKKIQSRFAQNHRAEFTFSDAVVDVIAARCTQVGSGARLIDNILTNTLLPRMSEAVLEAMATGQPVRSVKLDADENGEFSYDIAT